MKQTENETDHLAFSEKIIVGEISEKKDVVDTNAMSAPHKANFDTLSLISTEFNENSINFDDTISAIECAPIIETNLHALVEKHAESKDQYEYSSNFRIKTKERMPELCKGKTPLKPWSFLEKTTPNFESLVLNVENIGISQKCPKKWKISAPITTDDCPSSNVPIPVQSNDIPSIVVPKFRPVTSPVKTNLFELQLPLVQQRPKTTTATSSNVKKLVYKKEEDNIKCPKLALEYDCLRYKNSTVKVSRPITGIERRKHVSEPLSIGFSKYIVSPESIDIMVPSPPLMAQQPEKSESRNLSIQNATIDCTPPKQIIPPFIKQFMMKKPKQKKPLADTKEAKFVVFQAPENPISSTRHANLQSKKKKKSLKKVYSESDIDPKYRKKHQPLNANFDEKQYGALKINKAKSHQKDSRQTKNEILTFVIFRDEFNDQPRIQTESRNMQKKRPKRVPRLQRTAKQNISSNNDGVINIDLFEEPTAWDL